jgi:hypothetical protein
MARIDGNARLTSGWPALEHRDTHLRANFEAQALVERDRGRVRRPGVQEWSLAASLDFGRHCG